MNVSKDRGSQKTPVIYPYLMGCLTVTMVFLLVCLFVGYKIGLKNISNLFSKVLPTAKYKKVLSLPKDVLKELTELNAVIENAGNPTNQPEHNTLAVIPDDELTYVLRPNTKMFVSMLKSTKAFNFDPPVLYLNYVDQFRMSERLRTYIKKESRLQYSYSTDNHGFRRTLPDVDASQQVLIIGDSVPFGVGVADEYTAASHLQRLVGERYRIINASVGGYDAQQAFFMARKISSNTRFSGLIYVACQNDFMQKGDWIQEAHNVLAKIKSISARFGDNVIIVLHTYMEYTLRDIFLENGWKEERIEKTHALRSALPGMSKEYGYRYYDWTDIVDDFMKVERSVFSRFALYADHCHLSPLGNRLMAEKLFKTMEYKWEEKM
jgi:lysophospholipase L1-like esterase